MVCGYFGMEGKIAVQCEDLQMLERASSPPTHTLFSAPYQNPQMPYPKPSPMRLGVALQQFPITLPDTHRVPTTVERRQLFYNPM
jgi:hypothetical protein